MNRMHKDDIELIAAKVAEKSEQAAKSFWIEAESHYKDHLALREVVAAYKTAQGLFWRVVLGLAVVGSVIAAGVYSIYATLTFKGGVS